MERQGKRVSEDKKTKAISDVGPISRDQGKRRWVMIKSTGDAPRVSTKIVNLQTHAATTSATSGQTHRRARLNTNNQKKRF